MANERFIANAKRITRFSEHLFLGGDERGLKRGEENNNIKKKDEEWEDGEARQARKRAEGLKIQTEMRNTSIPSKSIVIEEEAVHISCFISTVSSE